MPPDFPVYAVYSAEGKKAVRQAIQRYLDKAVARAKELGITGLKARLAAFQSDNVETPKGYSCDDFFGWMDPESYDNDGNFKGGQDAS